MDVTTTEQAIDPKLIARIRKMYALSKDGGATEGEADNAARMVQKLCLENNISLAQVESMGGVGEEGSARTKTGRKGNAMYKFQQTLMAACADVNFVYQEVSYRYTNGHRRAKGYVLIGREANVVATQLLFDYLASTCENLGIEYVGGDNRRRMSIEALSFKEGCADRIAERLRTRHEEQLAEQKREARQRNAAASHPSAATGTALVVVMEDYEQAEADRNNDLRLNKPEGYTTARRLRATRRSEIESAIQDALNAHLRSDDFDLLTAACEAAVDALCANRGWDRSDEAVAADVAAELKYEISSHINRIKFSQAEEERRAKLTQAQRDREDAKRERENEKAWQSYWRRQERGSGGGGPQRNIDYSAYRDGSRAGDGVGLDKQVGREDRKAIK
jgi:hypothetical protein